MRPSKQHIVIGPSKQHTVIGLTGTIASGKSTITKYLQNYFDAEDPDFLVHTISADLLAHELYVPNSNILSEIASEFGRKVVNDEDGSLNRKALSEIVFENPAKRKILNEIVWPHIKYKIIQQLDVVKKNTHTTALFIVEVPVLLETDWLDLFDEVWYIYSGLECCRERAALRGTDPGDAEIRWKLQANTEAAILKSWSGKPEDLIIIDNTDGKASVALLDRAKYWRRKLKEDFADRIV